MGEIFDRLFPYYLSIGMTYELYWQGPAELVKAYREAERLRNDTRNAEMWLQGMYFYEALCDASPIFHDFAKRGTKPRPYPSQPYNIHPERKKDDGGVRAEEKKKMQKGLRFMQQQVARASQKKQQKQEVKKGND